jgi:hypothetical protein
LHHSWLKIHLNFVDFIIMISTPVKKEAPLSHQMATSAQLRGGHNPLAIEELLYDLAVSALLSGLEVKQR